MKSDSRKKVAGKVLLCLLLAVLCAVLFLLVKIFYPVSILQAAHIPPSNVDRISFLESGLPGEYAQAVALTSDRDIAAFLDLLFETRVHHFSFADQNKWMSFYYEHLGMYQIAFSGDGLVLTLGLALDGTIFVDGGKYQYRLVEEDAELFFNEFFRLSGLTRRGTPATS